jgi:hypothetical protein
MFSISIINIKNKYLISAKRQKISDVRLIILIKLSHIVLFV